MTEAARPAGSLRRQGRAALGWASLRVAAIDVSRVVTPPAHAEAPAFKGPVPLQLGSFGRLLMGGEICFRGLVLTQPTDLRSYDSK
jgi:hypothetical protein